MMRSVLKMTNPKDLFMLCGSVTEKELKNYKNNSFIANVKYDGCRMMCIKKGEDIIMFSRNGNIITYKFPEVLEEVKKIEGDFIIDGEIISFCGNFNKLQKRALTKNLNKIKQLVNEIPVRFMVFDILSYKGDYIIDKPLKERIKLLRDLFIDNNYIQMCEYGDIDKLLKEVIDKNGEGIIIKNLNGVYEPSKRSNNWLKYKLFKETTITITGYTENFKGIRATTDEGIAVQIGGFQSNEVKNILDSKGYCDINIQYLSKSDEGKFRFPSYRNIVN
jgi:DNA ligase-1